MAKYFTGVKMNEFRYSEWDGSQDLFALNADELMDQLGENLLSHWDVAEALRRMQNGGLLDSEGRRLPSVEDILHRLENMKQAQLEKYDIGSVVDETARKLADIIYNERLGIQRKLDESREKTPDGLSPEVQQRLLKSLEDRTKHNLSKLDSLPWDIAGQVRELAGYDFMDETARSQFQELLDILKKHALESYGRDMLKKLKEMDGSSLANIRHMTEALNQMLEQRMRGEEPDFNGFMEQFGHYFGDTPPQYFEEMIGRIQEQIAQAQTLMDSLSDEDREAMRNMLNSMLDEVTKHELLKMAQNIEALYPGGKLRKHYSFTGEQPITFDGALELMETLQKMEQLEEQLREAMNFRSLDSIDSGLTRELMGDQAREELERLRQVSKALEESGYLVKQNGKYELTPRGMRKIGQKAMEDIFARLRKEGIGRHRLDLQGTGGEIIPETKKMEFGDDFRINLQKTIMNSLYRERAIPLKLIVDDFEIYKTEQISRSATVLMLDMSLSMPMRGNFDAAKRVTLALDGLIRSQYPKDILHIVGFSSSARIIKTEDVSKIGWDQFDPYTNMQNGLHVARKLLENDRCSNKQIIMVTDGEPTAHNEGEQIFFQYPPSSRTIEATLEEVKRCTQNGIIINTFMLDSSNLLGDFVNQMTRLNHGRVFFTNADTLGQYLLVDYISNKRKRI
jgi:uncharacterized protein with von Willebrand factor type A (vWA) domain